MSAFRDAVARDIKAVFLNTDEFAETHTINGKKLLAVVDTHQIQKYSDTQSRPVYGVFVNMVTVYVDARDLDQPVEGQTLRIDGRLHIVESVSIEGGMLAITAGANES